MTRGGKREGAGRPQVDEADKRITGSVSMTAAEWAALDAYVVERTLPGRGYAVAMLLREKDNMVKDREQRARMDQAMSDSRKRTAAKKKKANKT